MNVQKILLLCLVPTLLFGKVEESYIDNQEMIVQKVKGFIISGENNSPPDYILKTTKGVLFYRVRPPEDMDVQILFCKSLEKEMIGRPLTFKDVQECKRKIADYYLKQCHRHVAVTLPEQDCTNGVIVVKVSESKVGDITVTGNYWFSKERYLQYITLAHNDILNCDELFAGVNRINSSPWRKAEVIYKAGKNPLETDIELVVEDKKPINFYAGADNTGFRITEYSRLYIGFNWGNMFDLDQVLAFCYTTSPDFSGYQSFFLDYSAPLPNDDRLRVYGGYSRIQAEDVSLPLALNLGQAWQISGRYDLALPQSLKMHQTIDFGLDYKSTNNDFIVNETNIAKLPVTIFQLAAEYTGGLKFDGHHVSGKALMLAQPWQIGSSMSDSAYSALRPDSNPLYFILRGSSKYTYQEDNNKAFSAKVRLQGQIASDALIPIEQFGLGGIDSVRGYVDREVNTDNACIFNFDVRTPQISLFKYINEKYRTLDRLCGVVFLDIGNGWIYKPMVGQPSYYFLAGIGPGVRYDVSNNLYTRFDLGIRLGDVPFEASYDSRVRFYFSLIATY